MERRLTSGCPDTEGLLSNRAESKKAATTAAAADITRTMTIAGPSSTRRPPVGWAATVLLASSGAAFTVSPSLHRHSRRLQHPNNANVETTGRSRWAEG